MYPDLVDLGDAAMAQPAKQLRFKRARAGFNGAGNPKVGLLTLLFGLFVMGLPSALLLNKFMGLNSAWIGLSIANLTGAAAAFVVFLRWFAADTKTADL